MENWMWIALGAVALYFVMRPGVPADARLSPAQVKEAVSGQARPQLVDVRTKAEFDSGHLAGARNIPLDRLAVGFGELDKSRPVILYCRSGNRSGAAWKLLDREGFKDVKHMEGGTLAWHRAGLPYEG